MRRGRPHPALEPARPPRRRARDRLAPWCVVLSLCAFHSPPGDARGQSLRLDPVEKPALSGAPVNERLARDLRRSAAASGGRAEAATTEADRLGARVSEAWRSLAARLLERAGAGEDEVSGAALVAGLAMARAVPRVDELAGAFAREGDAAKSERMGAAFRAFLHAAARAEPGADSAGAIDALLRDTAGELAEAAGLAPEPAYGGWPRAPAGAEAPPDLDALERALADAEAAGVISVPGLEAAREMLPSFRAGAVRIGFSAAAIEAAGLIRSVLRLADELARASKRGGKGGADGASALPLDERTIAAAGAFVGGALERFARRETRDASRAELRAIAEVGDLAAAIGALGGPGADLRAARRAAAAAVGRLAEPGGVEGASSGARAARRVLTHSMDRRALPARRELPGELHRAWTRLEADYAAAEARAFEAMEPFVRDPDLARRPEGASVLTRQRDAARAMRNLVDLRAFVERRAGPRAAARDDSSEAGRTRRAFTRLLRRLEAPGEREAAVRELSRLAIAARRFERVPGEAALRAGDEAMRAALGGRAAEILAAIDEARARWLSEWAAAPDQPWEGAQRLELWRSILEAAKLHRDLSRPGAFDLARSWAALEFPDDAARRLTGAIPGLLREPIALLLDGKRDPAADAMNHAEREILAARLLGVASRRMRGAGAAAPGGAPGQDDEARADAGPVAAMDPLVELATPPVYGAIRAADRATLAAISRWMFELGEAARPEAGGPDSEPARRIEAHLNDLAARLGAWLDAEPDDRSAD